MTRTALHFTLVLLVALSSAACQRRQSLTAEPGTPETPTATPSEGDPAAARAEASRRPPAGATCSGRDDCTSDQVCVEGTCHYRATTVSGEILASAAEAQARAGDWEGAIETYDLAFARFAEQDAPVSPAIACGAAELILRTAATAEAREMGAQRADLCFRTTVPGHPRREAVRNALARLRFEGLDIEAYDAAEPAARFFDAESATHPTVDAVAVEVQMPDLEPREVASHTALRELLSGESGQRAVAECFIQDWDLHHDREASAELVLRFSTRMRDMGSYDVYQPEFALEQTTTQEDGFEPCLQRSLSAVFDPNDRTLRGEAWNQAVRFTARIQ
ncbi:MAG: hypothetical protein AB8I08_30425 [Sandaracinaceae bacterium]